LKSNENPAQSGIFFSGNHLTEHQEAFIGELVRSGRYSDGSEGLRESLRLVERWDSLETAKLDYLRGPLDDEIEGEPTVTGAPWEPCALPRGAIANIRGILQSSEAELGTSAEARGKALLDQALQDLAEDPHRVGVSPVPDIRSAYFVYHVKFGKPKVTGRTVGRQRHPVVFSVDSSNAALVTAVVHEREMPERLLEN